MRLELQRRDAVGMAGDGVDRLEPGQQIDMTAVEDGASGDRGLSATGGAFISEGFGCELPAFEPAAGGADEAVRPTFFDEMAGAGRVV